MTWTQIPFEMPNNNDVVWCRTERWSGAPFLATYTTSKKEFTSSLNSIIYPAYSISYWRAQ